MGGFVESKLVKVLEIVATVIAKAFHCMLERKTRRNDNRSSENLTRWK